MIEVLNKLGGDLLVNAYISYTPLITVLEEKDQPKRLCKEFNTKTKKNRSVPISCELYQKIYKPISGPLFRECYTPFCYILKNKLGVTLPSGQASHVLRHTFASHFMMNGGNILVLRDVLGHADISMTMRYSHFAPDHLSDAISRNPLANL